MDFIGLCFVLLVVFVGLKECRQQQEYDYTIQIKKNEFKIDSLQFKLDSLKNANGK